MKNILFCIIIILLLSSCNNATQGKKENTNDAKVGLIIVDAQKWFIPGHPESVYAMWNITDTDRGSEDIIASLDSVLNWANQKKLPVFITYEGSDTGRYDLPNELLEDLDSNRTTHYVKLYYGAPKHSDFNEVLKQSGVNHWILIGAETDVCVYQTTKELLRQGNKVTLINEAIYSGRNNTEVSEKNLATFGAHFISINNLYSNLPLFNNVNPNVEQVIKHENVTLTVFPFDESQNNSIAANQRLQYLNQYAKIIKLKTEIPETITNSSKIRLVAGNVTIEKYELLKKQTNDDIIVLADCIAPMQFSEMPKEWHTHTLKTIFYELMETASFYSKSVDELEGWQKDLKKAMMEEKLTYVESLQNLK